MDAIGKRWVIKSMIADPQRDLLAAVERIPEDRRGWYLARRAERFARDNLVLRHRSRIISRAVNLECRVLCRACRRRAPTRTGCAMSQRFP